MDTQWIVTEIDGKVASIATDYRHLPHIGAELAALPAGEVGSLMPADFSDIGQAKVLERECGDVLAFHPGTDYLRYDGIVWNENKDGNKWQSKKRRNSCSL